MTLPEKREGHRHSRDLAALAHRLSWRGKLLCPRVSSSCLIFGGGRAGESLISKACGTAALSTPNQADLSSPSSHSKIGCPPPR